MDSITCGTSGLGSIPIARSIKPVTYVSSRSLLMQLALLTSTPDSDR